MTYAASLDYLFAQLPMFNRIGPAAFKKDLTNTIAFCERLGHPEKKFPSIHIAGTNGKGSVAHFLAAIFTAQGWKTGLYTSPHYRDFRERIKIDGQFISKKEVVNFVQRHREFSESLRPSFFEWTVALAFDYFAKEKVDIAIIETGLGGRLDSTNVLSPLLSVVTNIGYDHQQFLGDTLPEIAGEKAGIIKPGLPAVIGETHPDTRVVFEKKAAECGSPIYFADQYFRADLLKKSDTHSFYSVSLFEKKGKANLPLLPVLQELLKAPLALNHLGDYQQKNLCTVLMTLQVAGAYYPELLPSDPSAIRQGLEQVKALSNFIGRWEFISQNPPVLCDSGHNEDGIRVVLEGLSKMSYRRLHFVFGMVSDKSPDKVLVQLPKDAAYYFAKANIPRGLDAAILQQTAAGFGLHGKAYTSVPRALAAAKRKARKGDLVFVGGSIFVVAEVV